MSEIRFIEAQGDLLDAAITEASRRKPETVLTRLRSRLRPHKRFAVVVVALVVAGCAAAAATGLLGSSSNERLAVGTVDCYYGTGTASSVANNIGDSDALVTGAALLAGETPSALCRQQFKQYSPSDLKDVGLRPVRNPQLISCRKNASTAAVFIASGTADQCRHLGLAPLPPDFAAASTAVYALATQLRTLYLSRDCWQPRAFARAAQSTLVQYGFTDWRVVLPNPGKTVRSSPIGLGRCAALAAPAPNSGDSYQSLDGINRTLNLDLGIPRSINTLLNHVDNELSADTWSRCYTPSGLRALVDQAFASSRMTPRIAITTNPNAGPGYGRFSFGTAAQTRHFQRDCPILFLSWPTINDRTVLVWFMARDGTPFRAGRPHVPPLADFHG